MFFGRRKHAAPAAATLAPLPLAASADSARATAPQLTDELIFAAVQHTLTEVFGEHGQWTVAQRSDDQDDVIFHEVLVHSLATAVTASVSAIKDAALKDAATKDAATTDAAARAVDTIEAGPLGLLRAPRIPAPANEPEQADDAQEPAALRWEPAPITRWADLKRPVTGPVAIQGLNASADPEGKAA